MIGRRVKTSLLAAACALLASDTSQVYVGCGTRDGYDLY